MPRYDLNTKQFAIDVYRALNLPWNIQSIEGKQEINHFARKFNEAKKIIINKSKFKQFCLIVIENAGKIAERSREFDKSSGKASVAWCFAFNNLFLKVKHLS